MSFDSLITDKKIDAERKSLLSDPQLVRGRQGWRRDLLPKPDRFPLRCANLHPSQLFFREGKTAVEV